jgi:hypothetical protein
MILLKDKSMFSEETFFLLVHNDGLGSLDLLLLAFLL